MTASSRSSIARTEGGSPSAPRAEGKAHNVQQSDRDVDAVSSRDGSSGDALSAREGDVLVVSYPECKVPISRYASAAIGGLIYTRRLKEGDDVQDEHDRIYAFLRRNAEREAKEKVKLWTDELRAPKTLAADPPPSAAPRPEPNARQHQHTRQPAAVAQPSAAAPAEQPAAVSGGKPKPVLPARASR